MRPSGLLPAELHSACLHLSEEKWERKGRTAPKVEPAPLKSFARGVFVQQLRRCQIVAAVVLAAIAAAEAQQALPKREPASKASAILT